MQPQSHITTKKLNKVKSLLPNGAMEKIADQLNVSVSTVSNVFSGRNKKQLNDVLAKALEVIEEDKKEKSELFRKIEEL
ncbi:hypothetical protein OHD16_21550 [Sphingobacterium sp. ML3W]|uniref:hypothetical protein n=1 Tax=Sphingobacterium sp. ML3W TaxID=1538644 RepID=UPI00249A8B3B|nr:hypothetical protein [Sphingobacterium sp. ML3W]WFA77318.1 hypothetical protein OGI71_14690 [Sphingobacterium sp. ML3W]